MPGKSKGEMRRLLALVIGSGFILLSACSLEAGSRDADLKRDLPPGLGPADSSREFFNSLRKIEQRNSALALKAEIEAARCRRPDSRHRVPVDPAQVRPDADYILLAQFLDPASPANGAINNVYGAPTWVVPRENALAILGLLESAKITGDAGYAEQARLAMDYLVRVQDTDGGWFDQYNHEHPTILSKSPTQTAEVMMALDKLGCSQAWYDAMKKGAEFLISLQDVSNKGGIDDGLISGGKKEDGSYHTWRWASDNSFAYLALKAASRWAEKNGDKTFARLCSKSAERILKGIDRYLYVDDRSDPDYGVWRRVIDENDTPMDPTYHEWINYAPQMLDLPARGVGKKRVGEWIHKTLQKEDGSVVWDDRYFKDRKSPGFSFQACLVWLDLGQKEYAEAAIQWAENSGLRQLDPDSNGISGGWIDWTENGVAAPFWQRFIDTSFYWISVLRGRYDFSR